MIENNSLYYFITDHEIDIEREQSIFCLSLYADTIKEEYKRANLCGFGLIMKGSMDQVFNYHDITLKHVYTN